MHSIRVTVVKLSKYKSADLTSTEWLTLYLRVLQENGQLSHTELITRFKVGSLTTISSKVAKRRLPSAKCLLSFATAVITLQISLKRPRLKVAGLF